MESSRRKASSMKHRALAAICASIIGFTTTIGSANAHPNFSPEAVPPSWSSHEESKSVEDTTGFQTFAKKETGPAGSCRLVIWDVGWDMNTNWLGVQGARENCLNTATFTVELRKHRALLPDAVLGSVTGYGNQTARAYGACQGAGTYHGRIVSSTGTVLRGDNRGAC